MRYYIFENSIGGTVAVLANNADTARAAMNLSTDEWDYIHDISFDLRRHFLPELSLT